KLWPMTKFPVLQDGDRAIPESSVVLEYVDREHRLIPADPARALECRLRDRIYDAYVHVQMQKIVGDHLRPADARDPFGVAHARAQLELAYSIVDDHARTGPWSLGDDFTLADCSAFPALYYANRVAPLARWTHAASYLARLTARPSIARVLREAQPYMDMFPA
ncbi:MAG TPA: glutathione S-transferase family protein, partial [Kofleriaceae bacterium]